MLLFDATYGGAGGGVVDWLGTIPDYRDDLIVGPSARSPDCRGRARVRTLMAAGSDMDLVVEAAADAVVVDADLADSCSDAVLGLPAMYLEGSSESVTADDLQNFWRYAGRLGQAQQVAQAWVNVSGDPVGHQRLGEIFFLQEDWESAAREFQIAVDASPEQPQWVGTEWTWEDHLEVELMLGLAFEKAGNAAAAREAYRRAASGVQNPVDDFEVRSLRQGVAAAADLRLGTVLLDSGQPGRAVRYLHRAAELAEAHDAEMTQSPLDILDTSHPVSSGAEYNNYAVALLELDQEVDEARKYAELALGRDPESPVYRETAAQAGEAAGLSPEEVTAEYTDVVERDATAFQTLNNLGVGFAGQGDRRRAEEMFAQAVAAKSDYALGWFNLGVVLADGATPRDVLRSQAALARAVRLDSGLRAAPMVTRTDHSAVVTGLDVSRAVPAVWTIGSQARSPVAGLSWALLLVALIRLAWSLGVDQVAGATIARALVTRTWRGGPLRRAWALSNRMLSLGWGVLASGVVAAWPFLTAGSGGLLTSAFMLLAVGSVAWLFAGTRWASARSPQRRGWVPSILVGALTALVGYAFVPVPVDPNEDLRRSARWAGPTLLAALASISLVVARITGFPLVRVVGVSSLAMLMTALFPLKPFDGGFVTSRVAEIAISVVLLAASSLLVLGWV
ncbi:MAG: tetratricopeptide repeat protein [Nocardioides sp.]